MSLLDTWETYNNKVGAWWIQIYSVFSSGGDFRPVHSWLLQENAVDCVISMMAELRKALRACAQHADAEERRVLSVLADIIDEKSTYEWPDFCNALAPEAGTASRKDNSAEVPVDVPVTTMLRHRVVPPPVVVPVFSGEHALKANLDLTPSRGQLTARREAQPEVLCRSLSPMPGRPKSPMQVCEPLAMLTRNMTAGAPVSRRSLPNVTRPCAERFDSLPATSRSAKQRDTMVQKEAMPQTLSIPVAVQCLSPPIGGAPGSARLRQGRKHVDTALPQPFLGVPRLNDDTRFSKPRTHVGEDIVVEIDGAEVRMPKVDEQDIAEAEAKLQRELERLQCAKMNLEKARRTHQDRIEMASRGNGLTAHFRR